MKWFNPQKGNDRAGVSTFLQKLQKEIYDFDKFSSASLQRMRHRLHAYLVAVPPKYHIYVNAVLCNIKKQLEIRGEREPRHNHREHELSDHAFIRVIELIHGLNVDDLKDKAIRDITNSQYNAIRKDKRIVTIMRKT